MIGAELAAGSIGGAAREFLGFGQFSLADQVARQVIAGVESLHVIGPPEFLRYAQHLTVLSLGGPVVSLVKERVSKPAMAAHGKRGIRTERSCFDLVPVEEHL